jgi:hypothetical protein
MATRTIANAVSLAEGGAMSRMQFLRLFRKYAWFPLARHMCPRHESQEMVWLVRSSAQANLSGRGCAAQRGAR